jgi:SAM-dependent methyltransferase
MAMEKSSATYLLGHADHELQRLERQGTYLRELTGDLLLRAGLAPGMRVLDYGTGTGDVAMLAAEIVGPSGEVAAIERSAEAIEKARARAEARGLGHVRFFQADETMLGPITGERPFDAVVGRLVLFHQRDVLGALSSLIRHVRPGGVVAFQELDLSAPCWAEPRLPVLEQCWEWIAEIGRRGGVAVDVCRQLPRAFDEVGIRPRRVVREGMIEDGSEPLAHAYVADVLRSLLPAAERLGVATADEVQIDTLVSRLSAEAVGAHWIPFYFVAAWGRKA